MSDTELIVLDGRRVRVCQAEQQVEILDAAGNVLSRERIQVAAGSVQGLFSALDAAASAIDPSKNA